MRLAPLPFLLLLAVAPSPAAAQLSLRPLATEEGQEAPPMPVQGRPVQITLHAPADRVEVVWRENSAAPDTVALDAAGTSFVWRPLHAGVARIVAVRGADRIEQNVSVRYSRYPASGLFVLAFAGMLLFGGAARAMGRLLGEERPGEHTDLTQRPDP